MAIELTPIGPPGSDGYSVLGDARAPQSTDGRNGDYWINHATGQLSKRIGGVWHNVFVMIGQRGWTGLEGKGFHVSDADPTSEDGREGEGWLNVSTWHVWQRTSGVWQDIGSIQGGTGERGNKVFSDPGDPESGDGVDGDTWINTTSWDVFAKSEGSWDAVGNIKGLDGVDTGARRRIFVASTL